MRCAKPKWRVRRSEQCSSSDCIALLVSHPFLSDHRYWHRMPSVRVRRGSQYASLLGEDGQGQGDFPVTRPRSRTLASIYRPPSIAPDLEQGKRTPSPLRQASDSGSGADGEKAGPSASHAVEEARPVSAHVQGRVADHILQKTRSSHHLQPQSSRDYLRVEHGRTRAMSSVHGPRRVTLEGSQIDLNVPKDAGPGLLESNLSLDTNNSNPFQSDDDSLHHEDDIVE